MIDLREVLDPTKRVIVGNAFAASKDYDTAVKMFESALDDEPTHISALCNGAFSLMQKKDFWRAENWIKQALTAAPEHPHALGIAALIEQESRDVSRFDTARSLFEQSLKSDPDNSTTLLNYAYMLQVVGDFKKALEIYTRARDLNVLDMNVRFQRALCLMTLAETPAEWKTALDEYEIRQLLYNIAKPTGKPIYTGDGHSEAVSEDSLLIVCEQGIGDSIQMARYVRFLKYEHAFEKVYMLCPPHWVGLMSLVEDVDGIYSNIEKVPEFQYYIPAMSLMRAERYPEIVPSNEAYLKQTDFHRSPNQEFTVGLCWQGNFAHNNDKWRSISPDLFSDAFAGMPEVTFYSLQQDSENRFMPEFVRGGNVANLGMLADLIQSMDLIITVDTSVLHIAGASAVPTLALLPSNPDFRWGTMGVATPWYPSVTLLRATKPLEWKPVLAQARKALEEAIASRK